MRKPCINLENVTPEECAAVLEFLFYNMQPVLRIMVMREFSGFYNRVNHTNYDSPDIVKVVLTTGEEL